MAGSAIISRDTVYYYWDGKEYNYQVEGDEDGNWSIYCDHEFFKVVNGNGTIFKKASVSEALKELGKTHKALADAMLEPFGKECKQAVERYCGWVRDRKMMFHWN